MNACNPSTQVRTGSSLRVQGQPGLQIEILYQKSERGIRDMAPRAQCFPRTHEDQSSSPQQGTVYTVASTGEKREKRKKKKGNK